MYNVKSLAAYKNKPAMVKETGDKITIVLPDKSEVRVREKDLELVHPGPVESFSALDDGFKAEAARELWELVAGEGDAFSLRDIASFASGGDSPRNAWAVYLLLKDGLYFEGGADGIRARPAALVEEDEKKRAARRGEEADRTAFIERLKQKTLDLPSDSRFLQDIEALALGKSEKSRTMREADLSEDPVAAHRLLLETGFWPPEANPHPARHDVSMIKSKIEAPPPPDEERVDLTHLEAFAIDDEGSVDPDDAVSLETTDEGTFLYVHVADPASSITPGSAADVDARARGATFYAPEGAVRMLPEAALPVFALGVSETSPALSFKMKLAADCSIEKTSIVRSRVRVSRLSYRLADKNEALAPLFALSDANVRRRVAAGAAQIDFPEVRIVASGGDVQIIPLENYRSKMLVRECMLLAGEGAATWALEARLAFPYIGQEAENIPESIPPSYAGAYQLRRSMRSRMLGVKPALHQGLGLDIYTQVTSPLRRYTDLLAHQQIRAVLRGEPPLDEDTLLARLAASERAAIAVNRAERDSRAHWTAVYLAGKEGLLQEGIVLDKRGPHAVVLLPALGLETQTAPPRGAIVEPNDVVTLKLSTVRIPECEIRWTME
ncbi:MAG: RNB domain-containing ribonuclease [Spirochaetaceae bacterium]|jgi:exoribonuclease-2|nr:RNB domain-containing ribonuclease [Spirochaetaceae bacterium]